MGLVVIYCDIQSKLTSAGGSVWHDCYRALPTSRKDCFLAMFLMTSSSSAFDSATQILRLTDVMRWAVFSRSAAVPHSFVLRSAPSGQVCPLWAACKEQSCSISLYVLGSGLPVHMDT